MKHTGSFKKVLFVLFSALFVLACSFLTGTPAPAPTSPPPVQEEPLQPVNTLAPEPTEAPVEPTATEVIDLAATQASDEMNLLLQKFEDKGYISTTEGESTALEPFKEDWAQIGWFQWWTYEVETTEEFVFKSHFKWSTATSTPDPSGCGVIFGIQEGGDYYAVFLDNKRIYFYMNRAKLYTVGKTSGKGTTNFSNPAESDFALVVSNRKAYVSVDGDVTMYTLSQDQGTSGGIGLSLLSGTNKDYGSRCEATEMVVWNAK